MPIADLATYYAKRENSRSIVSGKNSATTVAGRSYSLWLTPPFAGVAPTTAAVPNSSLLGALTDYRYGSLLNYTGDRIIGVRANNQGSVGTTRSALTLCDRLSHQAGLSAIVAGAQTTNLPTAASNRGDLTGKDVFAALEIYATVGGSVTTVTCSYTDSGGIAARATPAITFGGLGFNAISRFIQLPTDPAAAKGFKSIESVNVLATTGTAGNFGVTLYRPLLSIAVNSESTFDIDALLDLGGLMPEILANSCLFWLVTTEAALSPELNIELLVSQD